MVRSSKRKQNLKIVKTMTRRHMKWAWVRWARRIHFEQTREKTIKKVQDRIRRNLVREYFGRYKHCLQYSHRIEKQLKRQDGVMERFQ